MGFHDSGPWKQEGNRYEVALCSASSAITEVCVTIVNTADKTSPQHRELAQFIKAEIHWMPRDVNLARGYEVPYQRRLTNLLRSIDLLRAPSAPRMVKLKTAHWVT